jgi:hypothetical protein
MDEAEHQRVERHIYSRRPEEVIDSAILCGFHRLEVQTWIRTDSKPMSHCVV